jgi:hypothetical protein
MPHPSANAVPEAMLASHMTPDTSSGPAASTASCSSRLCRSSAGSSGRRTGAIIS